MENEKRIDYLERLIQGKLEEFPRAIKGGVSIEKLFNMGDELETLKISRDYFKYSPRFSEQKSNDVKEKRSIVKTIMNNSTSNIDENDQHILEINENQFEMLIKELQILFKK